MIFRAIFWIGLVYAVDAARTRSWPGTPGRRHNCPPPPPPSHPPQVVSRRTGQDCGSACAGGLLSVFTSIPIANLTARLADVKAQIEQDQRAPRPARQIDLAEQGNAQIFAHK